MMTLTKKETAPGEGERRELGRDRYTKIVKGVLFGVGLCCGAAVGYYIASNDFDLTAQWPPELAAGIAVLYLLAMLAGSVALSRSMDEVEKARQYKAVAFAGAVYLIVYPLWFVLWKGGFAIEPIHWALFAGFWLSLVGAAAYYRTR